MKKTILIAVLFALVCSNCQTQSQNTKNMVDKSTVSGVDLSRYVGKWYEIARFDRSFEKGLVGVTATYSLRPDGKIKVLNEGYQNTMQGKHKVAVGKAKIPDPKDLSRLKVSFFLNFYADYLIMELDQVNYQYAMIGSNSDTFLWILSRTPILPDATYNQLLEKARKRGFAVKDLYKVPQS
jgi:lipocalin